MISQASEFKLLERGFKDTLVLIPGWATDYRIFARLNLGYNYLLPVRLCPFDFSNKLLKFLNKGLIDKISLFGWSLGGFLAAEFALRNPERVNELILLGIRKKFDAELLKGIKRQLMKNKKAYLYKFYSECFSADKEGLGWFKRSLLKIYIRKIKLKDLLYGLDYLSRAAINPAPLSAIKKIRIVHGAEDKVAPLKEADEIKSRLPYAEFIYIEGAGHIPFIARGFREKFDGR